MSTRVMGPKGSRRRKRFLLVPILLVACAAMFYIAGAQAVHDENVFQLDGNASTAVNSTPPAPEDWDLICKANNKSIGTLAAAITTTSATSITVNETVVPRIIPFYIQVDSEQMIVTARTGASNPRTYTVTRGADGTTAATHAISAPVLSGCLFNPGYVASPGIPSGTTLASPSTFIVDPSEAATDDILKGGTKDDNDIPSWNWTSAKPSPPKNDLTDGYAAEYVCNSDASPLPAGNVPGCTGTRNDKLLYFGADRLSINGSANVAFWFFQHNVLQKANVANGQCSISSGCPFADKNGDPVSHKAGDVSLGCGKITPGVCTTGDILIISAFGPHALINVYEWVGAGNATKDYLGTNSCFTAACSLQPLATGGQECGNGLGQSGPNDNACAIANSSNVQSPWIVPQKEAANNTFGADASKGTSAFFEGGINLTGLGLGGACFSSFLINSRSSAAGDSELHDKILGTFQRCAPNLTTQQSVAANQDGTLGAVQPGTAVTDRATIQVTGATNPEDPLGGVTFFLCGPNASAAPNCDGTTGNVGTQVGSTAVTLSNAACSPASTSETDGKRCAVSLSVNDSAQTGLPRGPLGNGYYCFRAEAALTNYDNPDSYTDSTNECFRVLKLNTSILTDPETCSGSPTVCVTNTGPFALADNAQVYDHAVVTGDAAGGFPEGTVDFYICNPSQVTGASGAEICPSSAGSQVGTSVTLTHVSGQTIKSEATSNAAVSANLLGVWCFRAVYTSTSAVYNGTSGGGHEECFTVNTTSSGTSNQNWLPNDHVVVSTATGSLAGTLSITLRSVSCTGTVVYTEPVPNSGAFTATAAGASYDTTNSTFKVHADPSGNTGTYYWRIVFTPTSSFATGFTKCETSTVTINDNP